jgi:hypothetical protein
LFSLEEDESQRQESTPEEMQEIRPKQIQNRLKEIHLNRLPNYSRTLKIKYRSYRKTNKSFFRAHSQSCWIIERIIAALRRELSGESRVKECSEGFKRDVLCCQKHESLMFPPHPSGVCLFSSEYKKARAVGWGCHARTMMNTKLRKPKHGLELCGVRRLNREIIDNLPW